MAAPIPVALTSGKCGKLPKIPPPVVQNLFCLLSALIAWLRRTFSLPTNHPFRFSDKIVFFTKYFLVINPTGFAFLGCRCSRNTDLAASCRERAFGRGLLGLGCWRAVHQTSARKPSTWYSTQMTVIRSKMGADAFTCSDSFRLRNIRFLSAASASRHCAIKL